MAEKAKLNLSRPVDRSLEAFKRWINGIVSKIAPDKKDDSMSEEAWQARHKQFWEKIDSSSK